MTGRNEALLSGLTHDAPLIEIGPSMAPVAAKRDGWNTIVVDHASRADLVAKYAEHPNVDPSRIEEVDLIWTGEPIHTLFPPEKHETFAAVIASHVIEHVPDLIGFLDSAARLVQPQNGVFSLAVPDKRWCFDLLKPHSTTGQVLAAHRNRATRHRPATLFDSMAYHVNASGRGGWAAGDALPDLRLQFPLEAAKAAYGAYSEAPDSPYIDCHAWHFTPSSFALLILELGELGFTDWRVDWIRPEPAVEFLVHLRRGRQRFASPEAREAARMALLRQTLLELRAESDGLAMPGTSPAQLVTMVEHLAAIDQRLTRISDQQLPEIATTTALMRQALRPVQSVWHRLRPLRQAAARMRGRGPE